MLSYPKARQQRLTFSVAPNKSRQSYCCTTVWLRERLHEINSGKCSSGAYHLSHYTKWNDTVWWLQNGIAGILKIDISRCIGCLGFCWCIQYTFIYIPTHICTTLPKYHGPFCTPPFCSDVVGQCQVVGWNMQPSSSFSGVTVVVSSFKDGRLCLAHSLKAYSPRSNAQKAKIFTGSGGIKLSHLGLPAGYGWHQSKPSWGN